MGIGNLSVTMDVERRLTPLTTPHGDREPRTRARSRPAAYRRLTTPHGDRELSLDAVVALMRIDSLPLMGIGNEYQVLDKAKLIPGSLPLMGIGNNETLTAPAAGTWPSLPLMGIGNRLARVRGGAGGVRSLPLMGIGNAATRSRRARPAPPHYPSWGSGTVPYDEVAATGDLTSLPLMGIGNSSFEAPIVVGESISLPLMGIGNRLPYDVPHPRRPPLTTPHGDREPAPIRCPPPETTTAHYPSWGSGTGLPSHPNGDILISLPLMGIGNDLIERRDQVRGIRSLPLMGIGNPPYGARVLPSMSTHYPSWGSGTRR